MQQLDRDRIVQIMPSGGWELAYEDEDGDEGTAAMVGWALTGTGEVRGLVVLADGTVGFGDQIDGFSGYAYSDDFDDIDDVALASAFLTGQPGQGKPE